MGIQALPQTTVRALGATQVLTDPAALVKELIDNALDANATSIAIEIHSNTLDLIQLRDNGHGIAPEDRPLVARRYCTSKISHDSELKDIGGSSLGFRGEALASAAELSGTLTISTRIEGEQVAAVLKINQLGEVTSQERGSLPVGTTVKITDFIKANPVRRQVCLKNSETTLKKIKRTLQAYAFARPNVRLALRVLKAKNTKVDWVYAPKVNGNAEDAAFKIVGAACASQCTWSVLEHDGFTFEAFLPRPDSDSGKISNIGLFVSLDRRPVSTARNTFKQVAKIFREALKSSTKHLADIKDPFLYLNISCPAGTYDANLEPAKDDVVFEDPGKVVEVARLLFSAVYTAAVEPEPVPDQVTEEQPETPVQRAEDLDDGFTTLFEKQPEEQRMLEYTGHDNLPTARGRLSARLATPGQSTNAEECEQPKRKFRSNMYGCDEEDMNLFDDRQPTARTEAELEELRQARNDVNVSNPWVLAKVNSSIRKPIAQKDEESTPLQAFTSINPSTTPSKRAGGFQSILALPTPRPSSPPPDAALFHPSDHVPDFRLARDGRVIGSLSLPSPQPYTPMPSSDARILEDEPHTVSRGAQPPDYDYNLHSGDPSGTPLDAIPDVSAKPRRRRREQLQQGNINKPFVPPMKSRQPPEQVWFDRLQDVDTSRPRPGNRTSRHNADGPALVSQGELGDLADDPRPMTPPRRNRDIRDFAQRHITDSVASIVEGRNYGPAEAAATAMEQENQATEPQPRQEGVLERRGFMPASELANLQAHLGSPEKPPAPKTKRRKTSQRQPLQNLEPNASTPTAAWSDADEEWRPATDSRAVSRRKSSGKLGRTKSSKLPLERIPAGQGTHNLLFNDELSLTGISRLAGKLDEHNSLLGYNQPALDPPGIFQSTALDIHDLTNSLHDLLIKAGSDDDPPAPDTLFKALQSAFARRIATEIEDDVLSSA